MKRATFGRLAKTEGAAKRKFGLALLHGWDDLRVERVDYPGGVTRYKVTGVPLLQRIYEIDGTKEGVNAPRVVSAKRRKGQSYRFGGG